MRRLLPVSLAAVVLAIAGCGGSGDTASTASDATTPTSSGPTTQGKAVQIGMKGLRFAPRDVTVQIGTKVTWKNLEEIPHNVTAEEGAAFESDTFGKDGTFAFTPEKAGTVKYVCTIHPGMAGTLTVEG